MVIKITTKKFYHDLDPVRERVKTGEITDLHECSNDLFNYEIVSAMEDHIPFLSPFLHLPKEKLSFPPPFCDMSIWDLKDYKVFKFIGNSRIDGNPIFYFGNDTVMSFIRNKKLNDLGI